jgi:hypothetical protein
MSAAQTFHPIAQQAAALMTMEEGRLAIPEEGRLQLEIALGALVPGDELRWAVQSLLGMACHAERAGHPAAAEALIRVAATAERALAMTHPQAAGQLDAVVRGRRFQTFSKGPLVRAPQIGERAPQGSVSLGTLAPLRVR